MAVSKGQKSTESAVRKLFIGVGSSYVLAVNPNREELEKIRGRALEKDPEYLSTLAVGDEEIPQIRIDFICKPDPKMYFDSQNQPVNTDITVSVYLKKQYKYSPRYDKYQIMDKYGRTAWATKDDIQAKRIPLCNTKDGGTMPANISRDYFVAYDGLDELVKFIRAYLNIPNVEIWENKRVVGLIDNPSTAEVMLDRVDDYFKGDVSELKEIISYQPGNKLKIAYGVKTAPDNRQYQTAYTRMFLKNNVGKDKLSGIYTRLNSDIQSAKQNGALSTSEFDCTELHEYVVTPTTFSPQNQTEMPDSADAYGANLWI